MELSDLVKNFVLEPKNAELLAGLTKASTEYTYKFVLKKDYFNELKKLKESLSKIEELKDVNPDKFSTELIKYLYEQRERVWLNLYNFKEFPLHQHLYNLFFILFLMRLE